jgi:hypothetical protein
MLVPVAVNLQQLGLMQCKIIEQMPLVAEIVEPTGTLHRVLVAFRHL